MLAAAVPSLLSGHHLLTAWQFVGRLAVGATLGVLIGLERQRRQSAAGVHTSSLVATGATLFAMIGPLLGQTGDRVIANIVTGIGFLAGGVILKEGTNVRGLNTAATLWATAAVGALAGVGLYGEAALSALVIVFLNVSLEPLVRIVNRRSRPSRNEATAYTVTVRCSEEAEGEVRTAIIGTVSDSILTLRSISGTSAGSGRLTITADLLAPSSDDAIVEALANRLRALPRVESTAWSSRDQD